MDILRTAEPLKCRVIDFFLNKTDDIIIGNEVMYGTQRKVVDLLLIKKEFMHAIEIKGDNDNLQLLSTQIREYTKVFDYVYVFTTNKHKDKLIQTLPNSIGLYIIEAKRISKIRCPQKQHLQNKQEMLYSINSQYLISQGIKSGRNSDETRSLLSKTSFREIHSLLINFYKRKLAPKFFQFTNERGNVTHIDDIPLLNGSMVIDLS